MSVLSEETKKRVKALKDDPEVMGIVSDVKVAELIQEIERLEFELYLQNNLIRVLRLLIILIPVGIFTIWLIGKLFYWKTTGPQVVSLLGCIFYI